MLFGTPLWIIVLSGVFRYGSIVRRGFGCFGCLDRFVRLKIDLSVENYAKCDLLDGRMILRLEHERRLNQVEDGLRKLEIRLRMMYPDLLGEKEVKLEFLCNWITFLVILCYPNEKNGTSQTYNIPEILNIYWTF